MNQKNPKECETSAAFNGTRLKKWQEQMTLLDVIDTRQLLASIMDMFSVADDGGVFCPQDFQSETFYDVIENFLTLKFVCVI